MSALLKKIIRKKVRRNGGATRQIHIAAFGKHPGWDDHIDDLGLESDRLIDVKRLLYHEGVRVNIDRGNWDNLPADERLEGFRHLFIWRRGDDDVVVGRLWSSTDGKGRSRYPMVVCAHCVGVPWAWIVEHVMPRLEKIESDCQQTTSASIVRTIIDTARMELRAGLDFVPKSETPPMGSVSAAVELVEHPVLGNDHVGFSRIVYAIFNDMTAYRRIASESSTTRSRADLVRPQHMRVPTCDDAPAAAATRWLRFLMSQIDSKVPVLLLCPVDQDWIDVIVGDPTPAQFFVLRAAPSKAPFTSDIPYTLDDSFLHELADLLDAAYGDQDTSRSGPSQN